MPAIRRRAFYSGVATSNSPTGPFEYAWDVDPAVNKGRVPGWTGNADLYLWYSASLGKAFMKHNGNPMDAPQDPPANYVSEVPLIRIWPPQQCPPGGGGMRG